MTSEQTSLFEEEKRYNVILWPVYPGMRFLFHEWFGVPDKYFAHVEFQNYLNDHENILTESQIEECKRRFPKNAAIIEAAKVEIKNG